MAGRRQGAGHDRGIQAARDFRHDLAPRAHQTVHRGIHDTDEGGRGLVHATSGVVGGTPERLPAAAIRRPDPVAGPYGLEPQKRDPVRHQGGHRQNVGKPGPVDRKVGGQHGVEDGRQAIGDQRHTAAQPPNRIDGAARIPDDVQLTGVVDPDQQIGAPPLAHQVPAEGRARSAAPDQSRGMRAPSSPFADQNVVPVDLGDGPVEPGRSQHAEAADVHTDRPAGADRGLERRVQNRIGDARRPRDHEIARSGHATPSPAARIGV